MRSEEQICKSRKVPVEGSLPTQRTRVSSNRAFLYAESRTRSWTEYSINFPEAVFADLAGSPLMLRTATLLSSSSSGIAGR